MVQPKLRLSCVVQPKLARPVTGGDAISFRACDLERNRAETSPWHDLEACRLWLVAFRRPEGRALPRTWPRPAAKTWSPTEQTLMGVTGQSSRRDQIAVVHKLLDIFECLSVAPQSAAELAERVGVARPTVYRILRTLQSRDFVTKQAGGANYYFGSALLALEAAARGSTDLVSLARPLMAKLAAEFGETVNLAILSNGQILCIEVIDGSHRLRTHIPAGTRDHLHSTALGKAILAGYPEGESRIVLLSVDRVARTPATIVSVPAMLRELASVRSRGFAIDREENEVGTICVAAAFCGPDGRPTGAMSLSGPQTR
jgi:DNA-binding IclR family transcriptional regulator